MNIFGIALCIIMAGIAGSTVSWVLAARRRRTTPVEQATTKHPGPLPVWGLPMACGIDAVNSEGQLVGTVLVRAPILN
jgi:hypothetical protein